jgi:uncharacterized membrane protein
MTLSSKMQKINQLVNHLEKEIYCIFSDKVVVQSPRTKKVKAKRSKTA